LGLNVITHVHQLNWIKSLALNTSTKWILCTLMKSWCVLIRNCHWGWNSIIWLLYTNLMCITEWSSLLVKSKEIAFIVNTTSIWVQGMKKWSGTNMTPLFLSNVNNNNPRKYSWVLV
jgi:hypothetical protein